MRERRQTKTNRGRLSIRLLTGTAKIVNRLDLSLSILASMDIQQARRRLPNVRFRVLIIGRANAGKTSILQRVCETTNSPIIYRDSSYGTEEVRGPVVLFANLIPLPHRLNLTRQWMLVAM